MTLFNEAGVVSYVVKVRAKTTTQKTYLFGSASVGEERFQGRLALVFRVDPEGEPVVIKAVSTGSEYEVCRLSPGETFAFPLYNLSGIWAEQPEADTRVHCALVPQVA